MKTQKLKTQKFILTMGVILVVLIVAGFITTAIIEKVTQDITEREIKRITGEEVQRITGKAATPGMPSDMDKMIQDMIEQRTKEIMGGISGKESSDDITPKVTTPEIPCDLTPLPRQFDSAQYYTGSLLDAHLHMPFTFDAPEAMYAQADYKGATLEKDVTTASIMCLFDKTKVKSAYGFYVIPNLLKGWAINGITGVDAQFPGRITSFIMPVHVTSLDLQPSEVESVLNANPGLFHGYGEIGLYKDAYRGIKPDDASLRPFYDIAAKYGLIVMMHPDEGQREGVEAILRDYPTVKFLFHGPEAGIYATEIVAAYPHAYYTIDTQLSDIPGDTNSVSLYSDETTETFVRNFKRDHDRVLTSAIKAWKNAIEKNPDKYLWGTDRSAVWHFDPEVGALLDEIGREFIGQLDPAVQEKFAWKNAERLMQNE